VSGKKGDPRLARLRTLIGRAEARCGARAAELRQAHGGLIEIAHRLEPSALNAPAPAATGAQIRAHVEAYLDHLAATCAAGDVPTWLRPKVEHLVTVLRRLGPDLYHCYDVPGLPRTDNDLEQFFRRVKADQRRITGRKRADAFVVRVGGFAVYATAAETTPTTSLLQALASVPADAWQRERIILRANQERQTKMRRFRLHRAAYLADLEARWNCLTELP
jgi:hypothetical protein